MPLSMQDLVTYIAVALIAMAAGGCLLAVAGEARARAVRRTRLSGGAAAAPPRQGQFTEQLAAGMRRLGHSAAVRDPAKLSVVRTRLLQAGFFSKEAAVVYLGVRAAALIAATIGTLMLLPVAMSGAGGMGAVVMAAVLSLVALLGPDQFLNMRKQSREREYADGFPDMLDLLVASVEAGLSLDAAVSRVTDELARRYPNLTVHLRYLTLELRAGRARKEAWSGFADRLGIEDARSMATMLRQAEDMGTSLGETLTVFSADMRNKRMLRAEEKALALPAKLTVPLILFIFPCLLGVLILPAAFRLSQSFN
ncbi:type II secretion system F family protein [Phenylobacterium sp.]|jgi:tight adherence protein C|uniref:type II secretion system F family protein n=1 Tax=Phenylobacterium sp. TaxID=1871053 RepID=UPI002E32B4A6|nr:type II secretion system F family protein [Phenylobacterium sp.]HEX2559579.1 type II secretion system F family protein [Phenylobacterium sp.]